MIVVKDISINQWSKKADCDIFADTKSEVTPGAEIVGLLGLMLNTYNSV